MYIEIDRRNVGHKVKFIEINSKSIRRRANILLDQLKTGKLYSNNMYEKHQ